MMIIIFYKEVEKVKTRLFKWTLAILVLFSIFQSVNSVKADDDEYEEYETHNSDREEHGDDEEEYEEYEQDDEWQSEVQNQPLSESIQQSLWNIWTRDTKSGLNDTLPFQEAKEVHIELNGKSELFLIVPQYGQLLVSGEKIAKFMDAVFTFYEQSRILEVSKGGEELIVRAGSNAVYENTVKTPMPTKALYYEKSVYLPISVIANSMGYRVSWNAGKETIILQQI
jgi:hypothetical protein